MNRSFTTVCLAVMVMLGVAHTAFAVPKSGFKGLARVSLDSASSPGLSLKSGVGFQVGGLYNFAVDSKSGVKAGLVYRAHNFSMSVSGFNVEFSNSFLVVPVTYVYQLTDSWRVSGGAYYGLPLSHMTVKLAGIELANTKINSDYGLSLGAGYTMDRWAFDLNYQLGLANVSKTADDLKLSSLVLSASYSL